MKAVGFAGYSGSGKTTLVERLIPALKLRGLRVSVVKHAHHKFDIDHPGKDTHRHREAGAFEVVVASEATFVTIGDFTDGTVLLTVFGLLVTAVFMVLGWKGGVFYGMLATLVVGVLTGVIDLRLAEGFTPNLDSFGAAFTGFEDAFTVHMIAVILVFIGTKMMLIDVFKIPVAVSLGVVVGILAITMVWSAKTAPNS